MRVYLEGIGLCGPGLPNWTVGSAALASGIYQPEQAIIPMPSLLPANERRRTVPSVRLALAVGNEAFENAGRDPKNTATVFTSSGGDGETMHSILEVLATDTREVSPTRFHNSVHNAPSGYWTIAVGCQEPSTSLCAYDASFAAGLLDAVSQALIDQRAVALIAYDLPYPNQTLGKVRPIADSFGTALVLTPLRTDQTLAVLDLELSSAATSTMANEKLEFLRAGNPAARSLPLLEAVAIRQTKTVLIEYLSGNSLAVHVTC